MIVVDNFVPDAAEVRAAGLCAPYQDIAAHDGEVYKRVCPVEIQSVRAGLDKAMGRPVEILLTAYRLNYGGELPNAAIHSDIGWGKYALVLYLTDGEGGTAFWKHRATGADRIAPGDVTLLERVRDDWDDASAWEMRHLVEMRHNRAAIYESELFHSRWPFAAFGNGPEDGRLTVVSFFN